MNILANESFGSRSSIRSLKAPLDAGTLPGHGVADHASIMHKNRTGGEPGNPLPCT